MDAIIRTGLDTEVPRPGVDGLGARCADAEVPREARGVPLERSDVEPEAHNHRVLDVLVAHCHA